VTAGTGETATDDPEHDLHVETQSIHQRMPFVIGSADDVALYEKFYRDGKPF
jgi:fructose-1,6-bisphosphatase